MNGIDGIQVEQVNVLFIQELYTIDGKIEMDNSKFWNKVSRAINSIMRSISTSRSRRNKYNL